MQQVPEMTLDLNSPDGGEGAPMKMHKRGKKKSHKGAKSVKKMKNSKETKKVAKSGSRRGSRK